MFKNGYEVRVSDLKQEIKQLNTELDELEEFNVYLLSALAHAYCALDYVKLHGCLPNEEHTFTLPELVDKLVDLGLDQEIVEAMMLELKLQEQAELTEQFSDSP